MTPSESAVTSPQEDSVPDSVISSPEFANQPFSPNEDEAMLRLVAAHTPSHRGLWDKDNGKALRVVMGEEDTKRVPISKKSTDSEITSASDEIGKFTHDHAPQKFALTLYP